MTKQKWIWNKDMIKSELCRKMFFYLLSGSLCIFYMSVLLLGNEDVADEYRMYYIDKTLQEWAGVGGLDYTLGEDMYFFSEAENAQKRKGSGWSGAEWDGAWTIGTSSFLYFTNISNSDDLLLDIEVNDLRPQANAKVIANGEIIGEISCPEKYSFVVEKECISDTGELAIEFDIERPSSTETDSRNMGLKIRRMRFDVRGE